MTSKSRVANDSTHKELATESALKILARSINKKQGEIENHASSMISLACDIGAQLDKAKSEVKHGQWKSWVAENISFGHKQAAKYIRFYNNRDFLEKGPSEGFLTSIDAAVTFISSEKKRLEDPDPDPVKAKSSPTPVKTPDIIPPEEGEECYLKEELEKEGRSMPGRTSKDTSEANSPDISNDTSAVETDDEPSDDTSISDKPRTKKARIIDGDFTEVKSGPSEDVEKEKPALITETHKKDINAVMRCIDPDAKKPASKGQLQRGRAAFKRILEAVADAHVNPG